VLLSIFAVIALAGVAVGRNPCPQYRLWDH
jgi:hypothetical protein